MTSLRFGPYSVELSNQDKVFFPETGITKGDLVEYYRRIAEHMVPFLKDRPLSMYRFPDGIDEDGFVQQAASDYFPDWIEQVTVDKEGGEITHAVCSNAATLVYLANQAVITPHIWASRTDKLHHPDRMIFDLDPPDSGPQSSDFLPVKKAARMLRRQLRRLALPGYVMTTGSTGLHVIVPLDRGHDFDSVRDFAQRVAEVAARANPDTLTIEQRKDKRKGRVFLDTFRNAYGQTAVPPFAVRAKEGAPVAMPLEWDELGRSDLGPQSYTISNAMHRLGQKDDLWKDLGRRASSLSEPEKTLERLESEEVD